MRSDCRQFCPAIRALAEKERAILAFCDDPIVELGETAIMATQLCLQNFRSLVCHYHEGEELPLACRQQAYKIEAQIQVIVGTEPDNELTDDSRQ
jgi:hypothetical protein